MTRPIVGELLEFVSIREVGPREGFQRGETIDTDTKAKVIDGLVAAGVRSIQTVSFVNPKYVPQWADAEAVLAKVTQVEGVVYDGLVLNNGGMRRALVAQQQGLALNAVSLLAGATDSVLNSNGIPGEVEADLTGRIFPLIATAKADGLRVVPGVSAAFGCAVDGPVPVERVVDIARRLEDHGADAVYLSDSTGEASPRQLVEVTAAVRDAIDTPIHIHLHDNRGQAIAGIMLILQQGFENLIYDTAVGGMGGCQFIEAAGNVCTEDVLFMLDGLGVRTGISLPEVLAIEEEVQGLYDYPLATKMGHYGIPKWMQAAVASS